jgi:hypothetical protein
MSGTVVMRTRNGLTRAAAALAAVSIMSQTAAAQLPGLIQQNIRSAVTSSGRLSGEAKKETLQLWIHVRSEPQKREVEGKIGWFRSLQVGGRKVDVRPIQLVNTGPPQSQLRFFKQADMAQARTLVAEIRKAVPDVVLQNMSGQYQQVSWVDPGHFEFWLAPNVTRIAVP